ncbi:MAG: hypothetical protein H6842_09990 [Rhodospirillaceae bacterium]|nr:hypothetical protein [Rhodospirillaceae bacterium]
MNVFVCPSAFERDAAAEIVVRSSDRRVLSARECCDGCIEDALRSLQELRSQLVSKRIGLLGERDGPLYQLVELMLVAIRQFLTFEQQLPSRNRDRVTDESGRYRSPEDRQAYFDCLELLRGHLSRCLGQVAIIAGMDLPSDGLISGYQGPWPMEAYGSVEDAELHI